VKRKLLMRISYFSAFAFFLFISPATIHGQMPSDQQKAIVLKRMVEKKHDSPRAVNDSFASFVFNDIIEALDPTHFLLTTAEYQQLNTLRYTIDEELSGGKWNLVNQLCNLYPRVLKRADSLVTQVLDKPLDFAVDDKGKISHDHALSFPANAAEMKTVWTKYFKWQMLNAAYDMWLSQKPQKTFREVLAANESSLRQKYKRLTLAELRDLSDDKQVKDYVLENYMLSVSLAFDPHTEFMSPESKEHFQSSMSTENKSFGFITGEKDGKLLILHLIPGGPAWKSGEINKNDQLLQMQFGSKEMIDVAMLSEDEVSDMLEQSPSDDLVIRIRKTDGNIKTISLRKGIVEEEENSVKGYVLNGSKKIGYISLPDFYTVWEEGGGRSCAGDVAKELVNLKKEGIEGLILDVRFNGGGSLDEALQLTGIFINEGPLVGMKEKNGKPIFLKDPNRGSIYDGPMLLMINGQSASASEALAGCLKDYNRAVIVGSPTFGKGSMQQIFPLDTTTDDRTARSDIGFAKITTGKFFRLDGTTTQKQGISPDIYLPDAFDAVDMRESSSIQSLLPETIKKNNYYQPLSSLPVQQLEQASNARVNADQRFTAIKESIAKYKSFNSAPSQVIPLKLGLFEKWRSENEQESVVKDGKESKAATSVFKVENHKYEAKQLMNASYAAEINSTVMRNLEEDIYIEESYRIISDLIQTLKK
jgi:carboxyl-terminal processing protease